MSCFQVIPNVHLTDCAEGKCVYHISIQTGLWLGSGTTANVGLILYGEEDFTDSIFLNELDSNKIFFARGSVNTFAISLPQQLGHLYKIRIWHDNSGKNPSWFLKDVVITEVGSKKQAHFIGNRWLAVERGRGQIQAELQAACKTELTGFKSLFFSSASKRLADGHLWVSVFTRPPQSSFTRTQRLSCCLSVFFIALVTNAMFYQFGEEPADTIQVGPLKFSWIQIKIGIQSALIAMPVNVIIVAIFKNSKAPENGSESRDSKSRGLPQHFVYVAWGLCFLSVTTSALFTIFYSLEWGTEISNEWLTSILTSFLQDAIVIQPVQVLLIACLLSLILKRPQRHDRVHGSPQRRATGKEKSALHPGADDIEKSRTFSLSLRKTFLTTVRIVCFVIFLMLLFVVCYGNRETSRYTVTKSLQDTFTNFSKVSGLLMTITFPDVLGAFYFLV